MSHKKSFIIFYVKTVKKDQRIQKLIDAAKKRELQTQTICLNELIFTGEEILYRNRALTISKNNLYWIVGNFISNFPLIHFFKERSLSLFPIVPEDATNLDNKFLTHSFCHANNIPTLRSIYATHNSLPKAVEILGGFPVVVKTNYGSGGRGVALANSVDEIREFAKENFEFTGVYNKNISFLIQEYIQMPHVEDYRVLCIRGEILGTIKRSTSKSFKANFSLGGSVEKVEIPEIESLALEIMKKSRLFMAGIDFIKTPDGFKVIELNIAPGFEGFESVHNISVADAILDKLLKKTRN